MTLPLTLVIEKKVKERSTERKPFCSLQKLVKMTETLQLKH